MLGRILAYMAGHEAELAYVGAFRGWDDGDDFEIAAMLDTMRICGRSPRGPRDDMARYAGRLRHWTRRLVRRHSRKIHRLASELMRRRSLTPGEIDAILAKL